MPDHFVRVIDFSRTTDLCTQYILFYVTINVYVTINFTINVYVTININTININVTINVYVTINVTINFADVVVASRLKY